MSIPDNDPALVKSSVVAEAEPFVRVEFHVELVSPNTTALHWAECGIDIGIGGLKSDLHQILSIPAAEQIWTLRGRVLDDNHTLADYGLAGTEGFEGSRCGV